MKKLFVLRLEGGLGNQLFQYAHARAMQLKYGGTLLFDTHAYNAKQIRSLSLHKLSIPETHHTKSLSLIAKLKFKWLQVKHKLWMRRWLKNPSSLQQEEYEELVKQGLYLQYQSTNFPSFIAPTSYLNYISGNYLAPDFFKGAEQVLKEELRVRTPLNEANQAMLKRIQSCNAVCLHVRLGDYVSPEWRDKLYICTPAYYAEAVERIKESVDQPIFFIFSNTSKDFEWIKENIRIDAEVVYVNLSNSDTDDFRLMYSCKHFIMSNSTYSWWAQWMGNDAGKIVVAPSRFNNYPKWDMSSIYQTHWQLITI